MAKKPDFGQEIMNLLHASEGSPLKSCIQCGTCSGTCPVARYMDYGPRRLIAMVNAGYKKEVLASNTFWYCASCFHCTVRCPSGIDIAEAMYALKRYSIWKNQYKQGLIAPEFAETFVKMIFRTGRSYEPVLATSYIFSYGVREFIQEAFTATSMMLKGRIPLIPARIKRLDNFKRMIARIIPIGGLS
jgi:heterodisulfide reductase subunit C